MKVILRNTKLEFQHISTKYTAGTDITRVGTLAFDGKFLSVITSGTIVQLKETNNGFKMYYLDMSKNVGKTIKLYNKKGDASSTNICALFTNREIVDLNVNTQDVLVSEYPINQATAEGINIFVPKGAKYLYICDFQSNPTQTSAIQYWDIVVNAVDDLY